MTRDEARQKWCPFARAPSYEDAFTTVNANRTNDGAPAEGCLCVADQCMAWRERRLIFSGEESVFGYCGLAHSIGTT